MLNKVQEGDDFVTEEDELVVRDHIHIEEYCRSAFVPS